MSENTTHKPTRQIGEMKFYSVREAAAAIGVHPNTIRRWRKEGLIKYARLGASTRSPIYIPQDEIERITSTGDSGG